MPTQLTSGAQAFLGVVAALDGTALGTRTLKVPGERVAFLSLDEVVDLPAMVVIDGGREQQLDVSEGDRRAYEVEMQVALVVRENSTAVLQTQLDAAELLLLQTTAAAMAADPTLGGTIWWFEYLGADEPLPVANDRITQLTAVAFHRFVLHTSMDLTNPEQLQP